MDALEVQLEEVDWSSYKRGDPLNGWLGLAPLDGAPRVQMRTWLKWVPIAGIRIGRHELDHLRYANFRSQGDHHDCTAWATRTGNPVHECGRSATGFLSMFRSAHLLSTVEESRQLLRTGKVVVYGDAGSRIEAFLRGQQ